MKQVGDLAGGDSGTKYGLATQNPQALHPKPVRSPLAAL